MVLQPWLDLIYLTIYLDPLIEDQEQSQGVVAAGLQLVRFGFIFIETILTSL